MKRLGTVENFSYDGSLLVRAAFVPVLGARVVDKRARSLGKVVKVFGPVKEPFASVRTDAKLPISILRTDVYLEGNDDDKEGRRGRRSH